MATSVTPFWNRFWKFVAKSDDGCWLWIGSVAKQGYGQIYRDGRPVLAHRVMLEHVEGRPLSPGEMACHHCDVRACVRPEHLYRGDVRTNTRDAVERGRLYKQPRKTHCDKGHQLSICGNRQICKNCHLDRQRIRRARLKRERAA